MSLAIAGNHIIFKVCLICGFDTLNYANRPRHQGPCFRCPECDSYTFVITCSECMFENSPECPLTQLLDTEYGIHNEDGDEEELCERLWRVNWEQEDEDVEKEECSYSADFAEEQSCKLATSSFGKEKQQDNHAEQGAPLEDTSKNYINKKDTKRTTPNWKTQSRITTTRTVERPQRRCVPSLPPRTMLNLRARVYEYYR